MHIYRQLQFCVFVGSGIVSKLSYIYFSWPNFLTSMGSSKCSRNYTVRDNISMTDNTSANVTDDMNVT